jgi:hypothetical protein
MPSLDNQPSFITPSLLRHAERSLVVVPCRIAAYDGTWAKAEASIISSQSLGVEETA